MIPVGVTPRVRAHSLLTREWDAIVVGSGPGGLCCAALLGLRGGKRVLVLERHHEIGGLTQTFRRPRHAWEVGLHYVGDVDRGHFLRVLCDAITSGSLEWARLPPTHDRLIAPGIDVRLGGDRAALRAQWLSIARGEERAVDRLLDATVDAARTAKSHFLSRMRRGPPPERSPFLAWSDRISADVLDECGASPRLALLATYAWTTYGSPPEQSSFAALASAMAHYTRGAFHPVGGGAALGRAIARTIDRAQGSIVVRAEVERVLVERQRARGVVLSDGTEVHAPIVVSAIGARRTFESLAPEDSDALARVRGIPSSAGHVGIHVGASREPAALGLDGANLFVVRDADARERDLGAFVDGRATDPSDLFVSTACAIDPSQRERFPGRTAITIAAPARMHDFARWSDTRHAHRGDDYDALRRRLGESALRVLGPHLALDAIDHVEVSTPLSTRHFTGHTSGEIYGLASTPIRFRRAPGPHTAIDGLYLTGQDVWMCGVAGSLASGLLTAGSVLERDLATELARP